MQVKPIPYLTIGLTGGIAGGKSTALQVWKKAGAFVLSCDELVREISARPIVRRQLQTWWGRLDKTALAKMIFQQPTQREKLERLIHPLVKKEMTARLKKASAPVRVVEVPLLFEAGWENLFDMTVAVIMPEKLRTKCACQRGLSKSDFVKRNKAQWPQLKKAAQADVCIINDGSVKELEQKVCALNNALKKFIL
ncbi:MAG: dephospho-CoA kinase [Elusimicrobiaceae bacterium]|nr:dephospho-CoA kinase [Elusimicrobiaceae bacterium]